MQSYAQVNNSQEDFDDLNIGTRFSMGERMDAQRFMQSLNNEEKQRYLDLKVKLKDGSYGNVITTTDGLRYTCNVCDIQTSDFANMKNHINGRKHRGNVIQLSEPKLNTTKEECEESDEYIPKLAPGEPVPPGFEDKVKCVTQIQTELDAVKTKPLIGLEFLLELTDELDNADPKYVCLLCEKKGEHHVVLNHLTSFEHYNKYIGMYFPSASKAITTQFPANKAGKKAAFIVLTNICNAIEKKYGRLQPMAADKNTFEAKKNKYLSQILGDRHLREKPGETFVELVDKKLLDTSEPHSNDVHVSRDDKSKEDTSSMPNKGKIAVNQGREKTQETSNIREKATASVNYTNSSTAKHTKEKDPSPKRADKSHPGPDVKGETPGVRKKEKESLSSISSTSISRSRSRSRSRRKSRGRSRSKSRSRRKSRGRSTSKSRSRRKLRGRSKSYSPVFLKTVYKPYQRETRAFQKQSDKSYPPFHSSYSRFHWRRSRSRSRPRVKSRSRSPVRPYRRKRSSSQSPPSKKASPKDDRPPKSNTRETSHHEMDEKVAKGEVDGKDNSDTFRTFRYECNKIEREAAKLLKFHEHNPEKHPLYPDEWKKFWNMRYKELQAEGKDPNTHDFKPEWIEYWNKRMVFLHKEDIKNKKEELKIKLGLPVEELETGPPVKKRTLSVAAKDVPVKHSKSPERIKNISFEIKEKPMKEIPLRQMAVRDLPPRDLPPRDLPPRDLPPRDLPVREMLAREMAAREMAAREIPVRDALAREKIKDRHIREIQVRESPITGITIKESPLKDIPIKESPIREIKIKKPIKGRSIRERSTGEDPKDRESDDSPPETEKRPKDKHKVSKEITVKNTRGNQVRDKKSKIIKDSKEADIVPILRLLTAMESQLGSLGPKVNNLMGRALSLEKVKSHSADTLLTIPENIVLFETVKEKLKGQLIAGIVEKNMLSATETCLDMLINVLEKVEKKNLNPVAIVNPPVRNVSLVPEAQPVTVAAQVDPLDKLVISQQIAAALVAEGKTDVTEAELEQLINAVTKMAQASKGTGSVISTAQFVALQQQQQLGMEAAAKSPATPLQQLLTVVTSNMSSPFSVATSGISKDNVSGLQLLQTAYDEPRISPIANTLGKNEKQQNFSPHGARKQHSSTNESRAGKEISYLSEVELQTLLQNFKDLSAHEQQCLITYLRKLEETEPARVEQLRKYVVLDPAVKKSPLIAASMPTMTPERENIIGKRAQSFAFSQEHTGSPVIDQKEIRKNISGKEAEAKSKIVDLDSDDDYTYEEIYAAASKKVRESEEAKAKEREKEKTAEKQNQPPGSVPAKSDDPAALLKQTKAMIANLMGQFPSKYPQKQTAASPSQNKDIPPVNTAISRESSQLTVGPSSSTSANSTQHLSGPYSSVQPTQHFNNSDSSNTVPPQQQHLPPVQQSDYHASYGSAQGTDFSSTVQYQNNYTNNYDNYYPRQPTEQYQRAEQYQHADQYQQGYDNFQNYNLPAQNTFQSDGYNRNNYGQNSYQEQPSSYYQDQTPSYY